MQATSLSSNTEHFFLICILSLILHFLVKNREKCFWSWLHLSCLPLSSSNPACAKVGIKVSQTVLHNHAEWAVSNPLFKLTSSQFVCTGFGFFWLCTFFFFFSSWAETQLHIISLPLFQILNTSNVSQAVTLFYVVNNQSTTLNGTISSNLLNQLSAELVGFYLTYPPLTIAECKLCASQHTAP